MGIIKIKREQTKFPHYCIMLSIYLFYDDNAHLNLIYKLCSFYLLPHERSFKNYSHKIVKRKDIENFLMLDTNFSSFFDLNC